MQRMMNSRNSLFLITFLFTGFCFSISNAFSQKKGVRIDQDIVQTVTVSNKRLLKFFVEDFMIPEENVERMVIYDLSGDGFGDRDIARTYPGGRTYLLTPSEKAQKIMNKWSFGGNIKFTANFSDPPDLFENAPDSVRAMGGIFASLLRGLRRNYKGVPIKMHLEQNNNIATIEMWGFNPGLMKYLAPPVAKVPQNIPVLKMFYLEKTVTDSIFTSAD